MLTPRLLIYCATREIDGYDRDKRQLIFTPKSKLGAALSYYCYLFKTDSRLQIFIHLRPVSCLSMLDTKISTKSARPRLHFLSCLGRQVGYLGTYMKTHSISFAVKKYSCSFYLFNVFINSPFPKAVSSETFILSFYLCPSLLPHKTHTVSPCLLYLVCYFCSSSLSFLSDSSRKC